MRLLIKCIIVLNMIVHNYSEEVCICPHKYSGLDIKPPFSLCGKEIMEMTNAKNNCSSEYVYNCKDFGAPVLLPGRFASESKNCNATGLSGNYGNCDVDVQGAIISYSSERACRNVLANRGCFKEQKPTTLQLHGKKPEEFATVRKGLYEHCMNQRKDHTAIA